LTDSLGEPPRLEDLDKPAADKPIADKPAAISDDTFASGSATPDAANSGTGLEANAGVLASEPLAITPEFQNAKPDPVAHETPHEAVKDAKAS
jgi:sec-independent protein translocase protein TatB